MAAHRSACILGALCVMKRLNDVHIFPPFIFEFILIDLCSTVLLRTENVKGEMHSSPDP